MRGKWEKALARIIESPDAPPGATEPTMLPGHGREHHDYLVAVSSPRGQEQRATVGMVSMFVHAVGEPMAVEVNFKTGEVRMDMPRMSEILRKQAESHRTAAWLASPPSPSPGAADGRGGSVQERLSQLKQLHDQALLTESEYQAKREQIISEI